MKILVIDTETTGLDITKHEIIQLGYILIESVNDKFVLLDKAEINIRPEHIEYSDKKSLQINGYNEQDWSSSVSFEHHAEKIRSVIQSADTLLGQNLIFDLRFIKQSFINHNLIPPNFPKYVDTKSMATVLVKEDKIKTTSLSNLCKFYEVSSAGRSHTALTDCERTFVVWTKLSERFKEPKFYTFGESYDPYDNKKQN